MAANQRLPPSPLPENPFRGTLTSLPEFQQFLQEKQAALNAFSKQAPGGKSTLSASVLQSLQQNPQGELPVKDETLFNTNPDESRKGDGDEKDLIDKSVAFSSPPPADKLDSDDMPLLDRLRQFQADARKLRVSPLVVELNELSMDDSSSSSSIANTPSVSSKKPFMLHPSRAAVLQMQREAAFSSPKASPLKNNPKLSKDATKTAPPKVFSTMAPKEPGHQQSSDHPVLPGTATPSTTIKLARRPPTTTTAGASLQFRKDDNSSGRSPSIFIDAKENLQNVDIRESH